MDAALLLGLFGMALILVAFFLEEFARHTRNESLGYNALNLAGALLLAWYAWKLRSWPFLLLNVVWIVVAAVKTLLIVRRRGRTPYI